MSAEHLLEDDGDLFLAGPTDALEPERVDPGTIPDEPPALAREGSPPTRGRPRPQAAPAPARDRLRSTGSVAWVRRLQSGSRARRLVGAAAVFAAAALAAIIAVSTGSTTPADTSTGAARASTASAAPTIAATPASPPPPSSRNRARVRHPGFPRRRPATRHPRARPARALRPWGHLQRAWRPSAPARPVPVPAPARALAPPPAAAGPPRPALTSTRPAHAAREWPATPAGREFGAGR